MKAEEMINWGELSRFLAGSRQTVRRNSIPKIHQPFVDDLLKAMNKVISKRLDKAEAGGQKNNKITPTEIDSEN
jgi:hypothetical protein